MADDYEYMYMKRAQRDFYPSESDASDEVITENQLMYDEKFIAAAKDVHVLYEGKVFSGSDEDAVKYGLDTIGDFQYKLLSLNNSPGAIEQAAKIVADGTPNHAKAFLYMMDRYEKLPDFTAAGTWRLLRGAVTDAANYAGLSAFGVGLVAKKAAGTTTRFGIRKALEKMVTVGVREPVKTAAAGGAIYGGAQDIAEQQIEMAGGAEPTTGEALLRTGLASAGTAAVTAGGVKAGQAIGGIVKKAGDALSNVKLTPAEQMTADEMIGGVADAIKASE